MIRRTLLVLSVAAGAAVPAACTVGLGDGGAPPREDPTAGRNGVAYVDEATCAGCHAREHEAWSGSHHDLAMQEATADTVLGDFDGATFTHFGVTSRFFTRDGRFLVNTEGPDGRLADFELAYTFGVEPLQQYLAPFPGGYLQSLTIAWDTEQGAWIHLYPDEPIPPDDPLHWTGRYQRWNVMCAECHSTHLRPNYDVETDTYRTTWAAIDVGCQACHGPGAAHVEWARTAPEEGASASAAGLLADFPADAPEAELRACAACHSRRQRLSAVDGHARPFLDDFLPATLDEGLYYPDGQIQDEVYVWGSFVQSRMHAAGVRCSDCHDPHRLRLRADGDAVCLQCHRETPLERFPTLRSGRYAAPDHHFHPPDSAGARCVNCHMPARTYMQVDPRRDHGFRIPRPDLSVALGTPNACTGCHEDRTDEWAADRSAEWWETPPEPHFAAALAAARAGAREAERALLAVAGGEALPAIVRATALEALRAYGPEALRAIEAADRRPGPARTRVRGRRARPAAAGAARRGAGAAARRPHQGSTHRGRPRARRRAPHRAHRGAAVGVRGGADRIPGRADGRGGPAGGAPEPRRPARRRRSPGGRRGRLPDRDPARPVLPAGALQPRHPAQPAGPQRRGRNGPPRGGIDRVPDDGELHYSLGLLLAEEQRLEEAAESLGQAAALIPDRVRVAYNHGLALETLRRLAAAEEAFLEANRRDAEDPDVLLALARVLLRQGELDRAQDYARQLIAVESRLAHRPAHGQRDTASPVARPLARRGRTSSRPAACPLLVNRSAFPACVACPACSVSPAAPWPRPAPLPMS